MSRFPLGDFDRTAVPRAFRGLCPLQAVGSLEAVDLDELKARGKTLLLIDVDNTLLPWRGNEIPASTHAWIERAKALGMHLCILSNTRHPKRLERLASELGVQAKRGRFKPSTAMYVAALAEFGATRAEAVMIGDQLITDVLGANRTGIDAIWVRPMTGRDFVGTKISRFGERLVRETLRRALRLDPTLSQNESVIEATPMLQRPVVRQFVKFCLVGGTSTVIDLGLHFLLMFVVTVGGVSVATVFGQWAFATFGGVDATVKAAHALSAIVFKVLTASIAILNSFLLNRRWTFRIRGKEDRHAQLVKFVTVAVSGLVFNTLIFGSLNHVLEGHPKRSWVIASAIATIAVAFWNFSGQKLWTFRKKA